MNPQQLPQLLPEYLTHTIIDGHTFAIPAQSLHDPVCGGNNERLRLFMWDIWIHELNSVVWEPNTTKLAKDILKQGMVAIDVGASIGYFTTLFARLVGVGGKVFALEPTPDQFPYLLKNIKENGYEDRVVAFKAAAWDEEKELILPIPLNKTQQFRVHCVPIDKLLKPFNLERIDLIKIDTDGSEPWVLKGMLETIEKHPEMKMIIENLPDYVERSGGSSKDVTDILDKYFMCSPIEGDKNMYCVRK